MKSSKQKGPRESLSSSKKTWVCKYKCKVNKIPCPHLEQLLPKANAQSEFELTHKYAGRNVDKVSVLPDRAKEKAEFILRIGDGLMPIESDILVLRYVYDETFSGISKELKLLSTETVIRIHNEALAKLKKRLK